MKSLYHNHRVFYIALLYHPPICSCFYTRIKHHFRRGAAPFEWTLEHPLAFTPLKLTYLWNNLWKLSKEILCSKLCLGDSHLCRTDNKTSLLHTKLILAGWKTSKKQIETGIDQIQSWCVFYNDDFCHAPLVTINQSVIFIISSHLHIF